MFSITIRERSGQVYTFHFDKPEVLIGRVKGNDVILPKQNISKRHAMIRVHGPRFIVEDMGSTNGTYVNGHRIGGAVEIGGDDKVYLGDFVMNFMDLSQAAAGSGAPPVPDQAVDFNLLGGASGGMPPVPGDDARDTAFSEHDRHADSAALAEFGAQVVETHGSGAPDLPPEPDNQLYPDQLDLSDLDHLGELAPAPGTGSEALTAFDMQADAELQAQLDQMAVEIAKLSGESAKAAAPQDDLAAIVARPMPGAFSAGVEPDEYEPPLNESTMSCGQRAPGVYDERLTGPLDGLSQANAGRGAGRPQPPLDMPGPNDLPAAAPPSKKKGAKEIAVSTAHGAGADPSLQQHSALGASAAQSAAPAAMPTFAPQYVAQSWAVVGSVPVRSLSPAPRIATSNEIDLPSRTPTQPEIAAQNALDTTHFDTLAVLYRSALRDMHPAVPTDAAQMSDTDWAEMEDRVVNFVDLAVGRGEIAAEGPDSAPLDVGRLKRDLIYELAGLGPLEPMLDDPTVETIEVNGPEQVFVFRHGKRQAVSERFSCQQSLAAAVDRLVRATGKHDGHQAHLHHADGTLVDGTTVRVVWPPLCPSGPAVLLRKPRVTAPSLERLVQRGVVTPHAAASLKYLLRLRKSIAIVGWSNVGRRTVLNAVAQLIEDEERIVVVEDGQRMRLQQRHVVRLDSSADGCDALMAARRLLPDRLLIGECAGLALYDLLDAAVDEGLPPWLATFHSSSREAEFLRRVAHSLALRHAGAPESVARARVASAFDAVASFSVVDGQAVLDRVQVLGTVPDSLELFDISEEELPEDLR